MVNCSLQNINYRFLCCLSNIPSASASPRVVVTGKISFFYKCPQENIPRDEIKQYVYMLYIYIYSMFAILGKDTSDSCITQYIYIYVYI